MRIIKFRAWYGERMEYDLEEGEGRWFSVNDTIAEAQKHGIIIMEYIGLKDKNGEEAYHKDKVSALGYSNWIIEWHNNGWKLKQEDIENYQEIPDSFIIIGNIYEEFLEKEK